MDIAVDMDLTLYREVKGKWITKGKSTFRNQNLKNHRDRVKKIVSGVYASDTLFRRVHNFEAAKHARPLFGAEEVLDDLIQKGHRIHILSHRPTEALDNTAQWLNHHGIRFESIVCHPGINKVDWCKKMNYDVLIDDHPKIIRFGKEQNFPVFGLRWRHNRNRASPEQLFSNWREIEKAVLSLEKEQA